MKIKQFLALAAIVVGSFYSLFAQTWTQQTNAPSASWNSMGSSANGTTLFAVTEFYPTSIYYSTDAGFTWGTKTFTNASPTLIRCSAEGTKLVVAGLIYTNTYSYGVIYASTNSGADWLPTTAPWTNAITGNINYWAALVSSADGTKWVAAAGGDAHSHPPGSIYTSADSGMTWTQTSAPITNWTSVASSADGVKLAAVAGSGAAPQLSTVYLSTNSGANWFPSGPTNAAWACIASSADGSKLIAGSEQSQYLPATVYTSTNSGLTWKTNNMPGAYPFGTWQSVAMSADGTKLVAVKEQGQTGGAIYTSMDSGNTWMLNNAPNIDWETVVSSADGAKMIAAGDPPLSLTGAIYTLQSTPIPNLAIMPTNGLQLSWIIPSTNFVLQQSSDLTTTNWLDVTNMPVLNLTNLQNQVALPLPAGNVFYRLKTP